MVDLNKNITYNVHDILREKFAQSVIPEKFEVYKIDLNKNIFTIRNLSTNIQSFESFENLQIFYVKENIQY